MQIPIPFFNYAPPEIITILMNSVNSNYIIGPTEWIFRPGQGGNVASAFYFASFAHMVYGLESYEMKPMQEIKAIIADYEAAFIHYLESMLTELWPGLMICGRTSNGEEAARLIEKHQPHLAFLDVRLPGICGMQVARKFAGSCAIVFVTAFDHYAANAYESGAVDYLIKPVSRQRLEKAVKRIQKWHLSQAAEHLITGSPEKKQDYLQWIPVQHGDGVMVLPVDEICYFKAGDKYTLVITEDGESLIKKPIKELAQELNPERFWRIHRGTIVNVAYIRKVSRSTTGRGIIKLKGCDDFLTVSRPYLDLFKHL